MDEVFVDDLLSMLEDFRDTDLSRDEVIDAAVEFIRAASLSQVLEEEECALDEEEFEEDEEDE